MIEKYNGFNIITDEVENTFVVLLIDKKNYKELFKCSFVVYSNYDKKGLIDDAIDIYKRK